MTGEQTVSTQGSVRSGSASASAAPFTRAVVLAMIVVAISIALSLSMPWYRIDVQSDDGVYYNDFEILFYFDLADSDADYIAREYVDSDSMATLMDTVRSLIFAWIGLALLYIGACLFDGRYSSTALGFVLIGISTASVVLVAANIGDAAGDSYHWTIPYNSAVTSGPASGYVLVLLAFVLQAWAILMRAWYVLPWIAEDMRVNAEREREARIRNYHAP